MNPQHPNDRGDSPTRRSPVGRLTRLGIRILLYIVFCCVVIVGLGVLFLQTAFVQNRICNFLAETASKSLDATVTIEKLEGNLLSDLTLRQIRLELPDTTPLLSIDALSVRYLLPELLSGVVHIDRLSLDGLRLELVKSSSGAWNLPPLSSESGGPKADDTRPFPFLVQVVYFNLNDAKLTVRQDTGTASVTADRLSGKFEYGSSILLSIIDASLAFSPPENPNVAFSGSFSFDPASSELAIGSLTLKGGESQVTLDGNCRFSEDSPVFSFSLAAQPIHLSDLSGYLSLPDSYDVVASGTLRASGTPNNFRHDLSLELDGAAVRSEGSSGFDGNRGLWAELSAGIQNLNLSSEWLPFNDILSGTVSTDFSVSATGLQSTQSIDANVSAELNGPVVSGVPLDFVRFSASWSDENLSISELEAASGRNRLDMSGRFIPNTRQLDADLDVDLLQPDSLLGPLSKRYPGILEDFALGGESTLSVTMKGSLDHPSALISILSRDISAYSHHVHLVKIGGKWEGLPGPGHHLDDVTISLQGVSGNRFQVSDLSLNGDWSGWFAHPALRFSITSEDATLLSYHADHMGLKGLWREIPGPDNQVEDLELNLLGFSSDQLLAKSLSLKGNWSGPLSSPSGHAAIKAGDTIISGQRFTQLTLSGDFSPENAVFNLSADHENGSADIEGRVSPWRADRRVFSLDKVQISTASPWPASTISNISPLSFVLEGDALTFEDFRLAVNEAKLSLNGSISTAEAKDLQIHTDSLDISAVPGSWNDRAGISGLVSARVTLNGPWNRPFISSDIQVTDLSGFGIVHTTDLSAAVKYADAEASVQASLSKQGTRILTADGSLPVSFSLAPFFIHTSPGDLKAEITTRDLKFSELPIPKINGAEWDALADMDLSLSGNILHPDMTGNVSIRSGHLTLPRNKLTYETIEGSILLTNDSLNVDSLLIEGDREGRLMVNGALFLRHGYEFDADLTLRGSNFYIPFQKAITARISPDLHLSGGLKTPILTGKVTLNESRLNLDRLSIQRRSEIQVVESSDPGSSSQVLVASSSKEPNFLSPLTADILVQVPRNAWLKGQDVDAEISGEITVSKEPGEPFVLTGPLNTLRGNYYFMGKNFQLTEGNLEFLGLKEINPNLNIVAQTRIKSADIIVNLHGTAQEITVDLSSDPAMDESDIISYLIFGRPTDNLGGDQAFSVEKTAMNYVGGLLAVELRDLLGDVEFIDTFSIDPASDENGFGSVTLGKYVTPELFISRSQSLSENESSFQEITYELSPRTKLETQIGKDSNSIDLTWEYDF